MDYFDNLPRSSDGPQSDRLPTDNEPSAPDIGSLAIDGIATVDEIVTTSDPTARRKAIAWLRRRPWMIAGCLLSAALAVLFWLLNLRSITAVAVILALYWLLRIGSIEAAIRDPHVEGIETHIRLLADGSFAMLTLRDGLPADELIVRPDEIRACRRAVDHLFVFSREFRYFIPLSAIPEGSAVAQALEKAAADYASRRKSR